MHRIGDLIASPIIKNERIRKGAEKHTSEAIGRRLRALDYGKINVNRPMLHEEVTSMMHLYGFDPEDFVAVMMEVSEIRQWEPGFVGVDKDGTPFSRQIRYRFTDAIRNHV